MTAEAAKPKEEFREIAHSGGTITIRILTRPEGRAYSIEFRHCRPVASSFYSIHVVPPGIPIATAVLGGMGSPHDPGPVPGCFQVYVFSDSEGMYGRQCRTCNRYWRSKSPSTFCAYCGWSGAPHEFLTDARARYVQQYSAAFQNALSHQEDGEYIIDLDAVADAVGSEEKPPFYYAEESQQNRFTCSECDSLEDILGKFGYCSVCGSRNDVAELDKTMAAIRERINKGGPYEDCVRDAVAAFDSLVSQYVKELVRRVPMTPARKNRLESARFHNLAAVTAELRGTFDIDITGGVSPEDEKFGGLMFYRRHVYEHNGGEADAQYIEQSGDRTVRLKQALHESQESAHRIVGLVIRMAKNLHQGFHEIIPVEERAIARHKAYLQRVIDSRPKTLQNARGTLQTS
jgi:hypothetical protein